MKYIVVIVIILVSLCLAVNVLMYLANRSKYYKLINLLQEKFALPAPYSLHVHTGFFGAVTMIYFFLRLKKKKKILFLRKDDPAYAFFDDSNSELANWMPAFYYIFIFGFICGVLLFMLAVFLEAKDRFFP
ncbi:hypothetical protein CUN67_25165 (plasmid) [Pantoea cypripedii]|uniref:Uncharacterized protein n=1 Tax=Pantoea cypripedii TaxID=55209 RepID=A0A6B9GFS7_PANCY|nr:hypothetical protein CUN67_25165 [Pantoea cypripedii]